MQKYDSLKELHIHIDLLKNSDHGIDILRQKLGNLLKKYKYIQFFLFFLKKKRYYITNWNLKDQSIMNIPNNIFKWSIKSF